jgi:uncharacterized protein (DUF302 family)
MIGISKNVSYGFDEAITKVTEELKNEGFGVLTSIDVQDTFKKKINAEFRKYTILGACNPHLALRALLKDPIIGLLLPCNVVVYETDEGKTNVSIFDPMTISDLLPDLNMNSLAEEVKEKLKRVLNKL